jgi:predicted TIM-barrel fold metal-dependent hydrolase
LGRMVYPMIIDVHNHLGKPSGGLWAGGQTPEMLISDMERAGISKAVALPFVEDTDRIAGMNDYVAESVKRFPDRLVGFFVLCPPHRERAINEFDRCIKDLGLKGLKLHPATHGYPMNSHSLVDPIFEKCAKARIPVICHGEGDHPFNVPAQFGDMADTFPEVKLIMAHMGWWQQVEDAIAKAKKYENLFLDTSYVEDIKVIRDAVKFAGPEKVLLGSDTPGTSLVLEVKKIEMALADKRERELVLGGNAARILGI